MSLALGSLSVGYASPDHFNTELNRLARQPEIIDRTTVGRQINEWRRNITSMENSGYQSAVGCATERIKFAVKTLVIGGLGSQIEFVVRGAKLVDQVDSLSTLERGGHDRTAEQKEELKENAKSFMMAARVAAFFLSPVNSAIFAIESFMPNAFKRAEVGAPKEPSFFEKAFNTGKLEDRNPMNRAIHNYLVGDLSKKFVQGEKVSVGELIAWRVATGVALQISTVVYSVASFPYRVAVYSGALATREMATIVNKAVSMGTYTLGKLSGLSKMTIGSKLFTDEQLKWKPVQPEHFAAIESFKNEQLKAAKKELPTLGSALGTTVAYLLGFNVLASGTTAGAALVVMEYALDVILSKYAGINISSLDKGLGNPPAVAPSAPPPEDDDAMSISGEEWLPPRALDVEKALEEALEKPPTVGGEIAPSPSRHVDDDAMSISSEEWLAQMNLG